MKPKVSRKLKKELKRITAQRQYTFEPNDTGFRGFVVKGKMNKWTKKVLAKLYYQKREYQKDIANFTIANFTKPQRTYC